MLTLTLIKDKVTKNGVVRYGDTDNHNLYLKPDEVQSLGQPDTITITVEG